MSDWTFVALGYGGAGLALTVYCVRLLVRVKRLDRS